MQRAVVLFHMSDDNKGCSNAQRRQWLGPCRVRAATADQARSQRRRIAGGGQHGRDSCRSTTGMVWVCVMILPAI
jgi:hypothetical protein